MVQMFQSGEIDKEWSPKMVYDTYPQLFSKYTLTAFRAQLNKYKTANGLMVERGAPGDDEQLNGGEGNTW